MNTNLSIYESLSFSTVRIECNIENGGISTGTGFFYKFAVKGEMSIPAIVTNKHVVKNSSNGRFLFTLQNSKGFPDIGSTFKCEISEFEQAWIPHPNNDIDLCILPIAPLISNAMSQGHNLFLNPLDPTLLPTEDDIEEFAGLEKIIMIGYPNGIWDKTNNLPIFRSGIAATHYRFDWNNKPEFLIDAACFPGSSGSPVLICDVGQVHTRSGWNLSKNRIKLLGILYAGPQHRVDGKVEIVPIPTSQQLMSVSSIPNNLGMVIKSRVLKDFDTLLK